MATAIGMIGRTLAGDSWTLPLYIDMAYPEISPSDIRTPEEIKNDILKRLGAKEVTESDGSI